MMSLSSFNFFFFFFCRVQHCDLHATETQQAANASKGMRTTEIPVTGVPLLRTVRSLPFTTFEIIFINYHASRVIRKK